jgi:hypothetical protein
MDYARKNSLRLLGIIILAENGDYSDLMNVEGIASQDQASQRSCSKRTRIIGFALYRGSRSNRWSHEWWMVMRSLKSMVGEMIILRAPVLDPEEMSLVKLHAVESSGLWIESQNFTDAMRKKLQLSSSATTLVLFVPFQSIQFIVGSKNSLCLSETAFGLSDG